MKYRYWNIYFILFIIFSTTVIAGNYINVTIDFENINFENDNLVSCSGGYTTLDEANNLYGCYDDNSNVNISSSGLTHDSSLNSIVANYSACGSCSDYRDPILIVKNICDSNTCYLTNASRIIFDWDAVSTTWVGGASQWNNIFMLYKDLNNFNPQIGGNPTGTDGIGLLFNLKNGNSAYCRLSELTTVTTYYKTYNFTIQELLNADSNCNFNATAEIDTLAFSLGVYGKNNVDDAYLDNIQFLNLFNGTNELPSGNITFNTSCVTNFTEGASADINYNIYDPEGDTIYYSPVNARGSNYVQTIDYYLKQYDIFGQALLPNYDFTNNIPSDNIYCDIHTGNFPNSTKRNLMLYPYNDWWTIPIYHVMLQLNTDCVGSSKSYLYKLDEPLNRMLYQTQLYHFDSGDSFNLTFYDQDFTNLLELKINSTDNSVTYYYYNGSNFVNLSTEIIRDDKLSLMVTTKHDDNSSVLFDRLNNKSYSVPKNDGLSTYYVSLTPESGTVYQDGFSYSGIIPELDWTTSPPTVFEYMAIGRFYLDVYVTDSYHLNSSYNRIPSTFVIQDCRNYFNNSIDSPDYPIPILSHIHSLLSPSMKTLITNQGLWKETRNLIWFVFLFLFVGSMFTNYLKTGTLNINVSLTIASTLCFALSWFLDLTGHKVSFLILLALSFAKPVVSAIVGDQYGS